MTMYFALQRCLQAIASSVIGFLNSGAKTETPIDTPLAVVVPTFQIGTTVIGACHPGVVVSRMNVRPAVVEQGDEGGADRKLVPLVAIFDPVPALLSGFFLDPFDLHEFPPGPGTRVANPNTPKFPPSDPGTNFPAWHCTDSGTVLPFGGRRKSPTAVFSDRRRRRAAPLQSTTGTGHRTT